MRKEFYWKIVLILVVVVVSVWFAHPIKEKINLGLDLQGGMHLVLDVEAEKAVESTLDRYVMNLRDAFKKDKIESASVERDKDNILINLSDTSKEKDVEKAVSEITDMEKISSSSGSNRMVYQINGKMRKYIEERAVDQGLETIRNRIDQFGVAEPSIQRQGDRRIIIQLPGIKDTDRAIQLIGKTAQLEFKLVDDDRSLEDALKGNIADGDEMLYQRVTNPDSGEVSKKPFLIKKEVMMTGESIVNAEVRIDSQYNEPYVSIEFDKGGSNLFGKITKDNVKKRLAIVLDNNVYSAPVIQEEISGGRAQITGSFTTEEAHDLAIVLRAGALPAPVKILENRTVGPSLGKDSIEMGLKSTIMSGVLILIFMIFYYRLSGLIANIALFLNLIILAGAMAYFKATLTLPGIAGIILTIGMAVDANILIYERIREELRHGKTIRAAIDSGFKRVFITIFDANITTLIAALVLFQFGTGPIKGFAVTLSIGIVASMFTAVFVSRFIFDLMASKMRMEKLSI
ncbi:MAG: protein-export membrane protein SecD [Nitrospinae bacterium RIFCSPLOWO2_01_FULL_39_10]|nr:MAG: protein-export membrane protein SecD [Nitrospinae bacterium RIFCSPLOWO2_01_FULL_39_10]